MILTALRTYLLTKTAVTNLIGDRIFPHVIRQGETIPAADMRLVTADPTNHITGWSGHTQARVVIDCYSDIEPDEAVAVAKAIRDCGLVGYRGLMGTGATRVFCSGCQLADNITLDTEGVDPASETYRWVATIALLIDYSEAGEA